MALNLRKELEALAPRVQSSSWAGHEYVRGYGVFGLPLSSGHVLALRVFPENDFAPYITVWHKTSEGEWSIYYDAVSPDIACPRYYGNAVKHIEAAKISVEWRSNSVVKIIMEKPRLEWTVWLEEPPFLRVVNAVSRRMPFWTWKSSSLLKLREWIARLLGMGQIKLGGYMPSGHFGILMPRRMYFIRDAEINWEGTDLGHPVIVGSNPRIGEVPLPARGVFAIGEAHWEILDISEYGETRNALGVSALVQEQ